MDEHPAVFINDVLRNWKVGWLANYLRKDMSVGNMLEKVVDFPEILIHEVRLNCRFQEAIAVLFIVWIGSLQQQGEIVVQLNLFVDNLCRIIVECQSVCPSVTIVYKMEFQINKCISCGVQTSDFL